MFHIRPIHADVWQKPAPYCKVTVLQLKKKKKKCLWGSESCGQQGLASSPKHLQGLVTPSTVRTPQGLLSVGRGGSRPRGEACRGKAMSWMPSIGRGISEIHWDCNGDDARLSKRGCSPSCGNAEVTAA